MMVAENSADDECATQCIVQQLHTSPRDSRIDPVPHLKVCQFFSGCKAIATAVQIQELLK